jgi:hypothetical protein
MVVGVLVSHQEMAGSEEGHDCCWDVVVSDEVDHREESMKVGSIACRLIRLGQGITLECVSVVIVGPIGGAGL